MKYLVYFQPNKELSDLISNENFVDLPSAGLHSTLCIFYSDEKYETKLIDDLKDINIKSFTIKTEEFDEFDYNCLVLKLSRSDELLQLHKNILKIVSKYAEPDFIATTEKYFGDNYNPHFTISKSLSLTDITSKTLLGNSDIISEYHLAKKADKGWEDIEIYRVNK